jgi:hypothetical protein
VLRGARQVEEQHHLLPVRVGAITADHLEFRTRDDALAMKQAGVIAG